MFYGIFGNYLLNAEIRSISGLIRGLPSIPYGYTLWEVNNNKDIDSILNMMRIKNAEIDMKYPEEASGKVFTFENSSYNDECFLVTLWFTNIFDYWFGKKQVKYITNPSMDACFDDLCMNIWNWIKNKISTKTLKNIARDFYNMAIKYA